MPWFSSGGAKGRLVAASALALFAIAALWLAFRGEPIFVVRDFEECAGQAQARARSNDERNALLTDCHVRFAGRRKAGGGYAYYDFMQDRYFDIAGPNPTAEERKQIDSAYINFLDAKRREALSAELAKRHDEQLRAELESGRQSVGPPMVLTPTNPKAVPAKKPVERPKAAHCDDGTLSCNWSKLSEAVQNAFASLSKPKP